MKFHIFRDNQQIGPYTIEEINTFVQQSSLTPADLCWQEGWAEWRPISSILDVRIKTPDPNMDRETLLFEGSPSLTPVYLIAGGYFLALVVGVTLIGLVWADGVISFILVLLIIALLHLAFRYLDIKSVKYFISTSRIKITTGIFSKHIKEIELYRIQDTSAFQSFLSRLIGKGSIFIISGDKNEARLKIESVPNHEELREKLRNAVIAARQKAKVRETSSF